MELRLWEFYSPAYDTNAKVESGIPDKRITIYWNPNVELDNQGKGYFEFYTSDSEEGQTIVVEGITADGKILIRKLINNLMKNENTLEYYIPTYIINLKERAERDDVILIYEDDHYFTEKYSQKYFFESIVYAHEQGADILSGGVGGFGYAVPIAKNKYWVDWFWCTQFIVVYKKFFQKILDYEFKDTDTADGVISMLSNNLMTLYPFISKQKNSLPKPYYILLVRTKKMREEEDVLSRNIVMYKMQ